MKIILEDGPFSYQVDWAKEPLVGEDGIPAVGDCIESFLRLLENIHPMEKIAAYIEEGSVYIGTGASLHSPAHTVDDHLVSLGIHLSDMLLIIFPV